MKCFVALKKFRKQDAPRTSHNSHYYKKRILAGTNCFSTRTLTNKCSRDNVIKKITF